jgi:hypothetical protein
LNNNLKTQPSPKFGKLSSRKSAFSLSALSGKETKLAFSELGQDIAYEERGAIFMKMQGKPGIVKANLIAIPMLMLCVMFSNADCLQELYPLLTNVEGFNL